MLDLRFLALEKPMSYLTAVSLLRGGWRRESPRPATEVKKIRGDTVEEIAALLRAAKPS
jgi:hypothetical protein